MSEQSSPTISEGSGLAVDGVYPEPLFHQRLEEEAHRAFRMRAILTLVLIQGDTATLAHELRAGIRRMDVLGLWKSYLAVLLSEVPREEVSPAFADRVSQQAQGILRIAGVVNTEWQEIYFGACLLPEQKSGKIDVQQLVSGAEKALAESSRDHQPVLYRGPSRLVDVIRRDSSVGLVRYGDLHLNKDNYRAFVGSDSIEFLPKEYELLTYLLKHEGKLIRREQLCKSVWGYDHPGDSRTVDMHIAKLRKKLQSSRSVTIRTLKGEGYRLDVDA